MVSPLPRPSVSPLPSFCTVTTPRSASFSAMLRDLARRLALWLRHHRACADVVEHPVEERR
jgi:hypothetical protein